MDNYTEFVLYVFIYLYAHVINPAEGLFGSDCDLDFYDVHFFGKTKQTKYCAHGCCGAKGKPVCCPSASIGLISALVVAGITLAGCIVIFLCCCYWKRKGNTKTAGLSSDNTASDLHTGEVCAAQENSPTSVLYKSSPVYSEQGDLPPSYEEVLREKEVIRINVGLPI